jgi:hypothetical protein
MALMLVRDDDPEGRPPGRPAWEPNWRVWRWLIAAAVVTFAAFNVTGGVSTLLLFAAFGFCCRSLTEAVPYGDGLRDWRQ